MSARERTTTFFVVTNALFIAAGSTTAAAALYPAFGSPRFITVAALAIILGAAIAVVCDRLRRSGWVAAGIAAVVYVAVGLAFAIPGVRSGTVSLITGLMELVRGPIGGWKDIVTLPLPLGEYGATLVPVLALLLGGTVLATWLAVRTRRWWGISVVVVVLTVMVAILVGPAARALPLTWAPYGVYVNREFIVGLAAFGFLLAWMGWRTSYTRHKALSLAAGSARLASPPRARTASMAGAAAVMVLAAVATSTLVAGPVAAGTPREVARTAIDPRLVVDTSISPLTSYRTYFSDELFDEVLFTVNVTSGSVDRVRVATLPYFDGDAFTASAPDGTVPAHFQRVPSSIAVPRNAPRVTADVVVGSQSGAWVPLVGQLGSVTFGGDRSGALVDGFFYQSDTLTGIVTVPGGISAGDAYTIHAAVPESLHNLAGIGPAPGGNVIDSTLIPTSLSDWVTRQGVTRDGAGLAQLVEALRTRGYLSHGLTEAPGSLWQRSLGSYTFAPSPAGHSFDRIDRLFTALNERASEVAGTPDASLVAAVGDDEQFAAAVALLAANLGFPSRVVLGAYLEPTDANGWTVPACVGGECRGQNMAVWAEVQTATGVWVPIDVTPQRSTPPSPEVTQQQDPKFASDLDPERAWPISPPSSQRGSASDSEPPLTEEAGVWSWLGPLLRAVGIGLLAVMVFIGPLIAIVVWKALRRRRRRRGDPQDSIHSGWDEYLDNAVDAGLPPLPLATRREAALTYATPHGERLAQLTDRATFSAGRTAEREAEEFWKLVKAERVGWLKGKSWWGRMRMRLSLRSVWHSVATQSAEAIPESRAKGWRVLERTTTKKAVTK